MVSVPKRERCAAVCRRVWCEHVSYLRHCPRALLGPQQIALLFLFSISHAGCGAALGGLGHVAPRRASSRSHDLAHNIRIVMTTVSKAVASVAACLALRSGITRPSLTYAGEGY